MQRLSYWRELPRFRGACCPCRLAAFGRAVEPPPPAGRLISCIPEISGLGGLKKAICDLQRLRLNLYGAVISMRFSLALLALALAAGSNLRGSVVEDRLSALENTVSSLKAANIALKAAAAAATAAAVEATLKLSDGVLGELRMFGLRECPTGWQEVTNTQGRIPVFRPTGAEALKMFGTPLKPNETNRVGPHTHTASVNDPGHGHNSPLVSLGGVGVCMVAW